MACKHPLIGIPTGWTEKGKVKYKIIPFTDNNAVYKNGISSINKYHENPYGDAILIPCGKCTECRLQYSRQWADRCMLELQYHKSSYFITLTYDDDHLPYLINEDGEKPLAPSLSKPDFQKFMKRLRSAYKELGFENKLRFYACGEYGTLNRRPHYHAIIFGLELPDLVFWKTSPEGNNYFRSSFLEKIWPYGFVLVADVTWETCAYTARYVMKKHFGKDSKIYEEMHIIPEFTLMSRKPGIAQQYYEDHKNSIYMSQYISIHTSSGGKRIYPPRYYDKLYDVDNSVNLSKIKEERKEYAKVADDFLNASTDRCYGDRLLTEESSKSGKLKSLRRNL